jgi:hypothetical protein
MHLSNSASDEYCYLFLAQDLQFGESAPEDSEQLVVRKIPFDTLYEMVCKGEVTDSLSVTAVLKVKLMMLEGNKNV